MRSTHRIASGRATLAAEVVGSGGPVVFLHARVADRRMWREQLVGVGAHNKARPALKRKTFLQSRT
jgi:hypothetical protein